MPLVRRATTQVLRVRSATRAGWLAARVRNVLAQRARLAFLGLLVAVLSFAALALVPLERTAVPQRAVSTPPIIDTLSAVERERTARAVKVAAVEALEAVRSQAQESGQPTAPRFRVGPRSPTADSLSALAATLDALIQRADIAPLVANYRGLAESVPLRGDARVRAFLDSLLDVDRERDEFGAGAAVDPVFVSLTMRGNALGRSIVAVAVSRRAALRREGLVARARMPQVDTVTPPAVPDTMPAHLAMDSAERLLAAATGATDSVRRVAASYRLTRTDAPLLRTSSLPLPLLAGAALVLGAAIAFTTLLVGEARRPRVADALEAERLAGVRVLSAVHLREIPMNSFRRSADRNRAPLLDPELDAYRLIAMRASGPQEVGQIVVVVGESAFVRAVIAANVAAALANNARNTLLVDIDFEHGRVSEVLGIPSTPGVAAVLENRNRWSETLVHVVVGRERTMDVIPSGKRSRDLGPAQAAALTAELERAARRYDVTIVSAPALLAQQILPGRETLLSVVALWTRQVEVARAATGVRESGGELLGVVLWEGEIASSATAHSQQLA